jgi:mannitol 2-dehydrogenase
MVHLGVGGFHRAHQAVYLDTLMNGGGPLDWGVVGVGLLPGDARMRDALHAQDCLYTVVVKHPDGRLEPRVVGSMVRYLYAPDDPAAVLDALSAPATRVVGLTVTEGGYHLDPVTGELDADDPALRADLAVLAGPAGPARAGMPRTAFGVVVAALRRRRAAGTPAFTVMSCDNLPGNGDVARRTMTAFARLVDPGLADWMTEHVAFPSSMVDRITPATTPEDVAALAERFGVGDAWPVVCEPFAQWVLEDDFPAGRPPLERAGVQLVDDVRAYELAKLRLLNGGHQAVAYLGRLAGHRHVHEACRDPLLAGFLLDYLEREAGPTLPEVPGVDLDAYRRGLVERFANPAVCDTLARVCADTSDRIPQWVVPVLVDNLAAGREVERAALVLASWARYAEGVDDRGHPVEVVDRRRAERTAAAARQSEDPLAFVRERDLFGGLVDDERFTTAYVPLLSSLHERGARATVAAVRGRG